MGKPSRNPISAIIASVSAMATPAAVTAQEPVAQVLVSRDGDQFEARYRLGEDSPVWLFPRSALAREEPAAWRGASWRVLTPGVRLVRAGNYDALVADGTVPREVRIRLTPFAGDIETDYDAALVFSDGSVALFDLQFKLVPMASLDAVRTAPFDSEKIDGVERGTRTQFVDPAGPVLAKGQRLASASLEDSGTYVLFGPARSHATPALTMILDPQLPPWLSDYLEREMPLILADYQQQMGPAPAGIPTLMASWGGPRPGVTSMGGSVLSGLVVMAFLGEGVARDSAEIRNGTRGFIAHEAAHFWLGQALSYESVADNWMMEGGADLLGIRAIAAIDPGYDVAARIALLRDDCADHLASGSLATATERGDVKGPYNCGALFSLVAEQAYDGDFGAFVKALVALAGEDQRISRDQWVAAVEARRPGLGIGEMLAGLIDDQQAQPAQALDRLIEKAGIAALFNKPAP